MGWTKRQLIEEAFAELAIAGHTFDLTPEEMQQALRRLDSMMALWDSKGIRVGYASHSSPADSDLDEQSGLPDAAVEPAFMNLAVRLAAGFGKQLPVTTQATARDGYDSLLLDAAYPQQQQLPNTMPRGAGNLPWRSGGQFMPTPTDDPFPVDDEGNVIL